MLFKSFRFVNFRGIKNANLDLSRTKRRVHTLVGLNESGKTTVLEAIFNFRSNPDLKNKRDPSKNLRSSAQYQELLPIGKRAIFSGDIEIVASMQLESSEISAIEKFAKDEFNFGVVEFPHEFSITHKLTYLDSTYEKTTNTWGFYLNGKSRGKGRRKSVSLSGDDWLKVVNFVQKFLPKIIYVPAEVFVFPDQILLDNPPESQKNTRLLRDKNTFYSEVVEDILRSINPSLSIQKHIIERAKSTKQSDKENLEALLLQMAYNLKQTIFAEWESIFGSSLGTKDFRVICGKNARDQVYLELKIQENAEAFSINERSAGFRWFFAFILLTKYRLERKDRVLFLFDEPANNLHPNAQTKLLRSLELLSKHADIIYSTHSHYLVNPLWLESTHIVSNEALGSPTAISVDAPSRTSITVVPYRTFVGTHPEQYFYYRPVMEALDYSPSPIEFPNRPILVEGKTDFFLLQYFKFLLRGSPTEPEDFSDVFLFPGGGAGSLDTLVTLLAGWGKDFYILVDSDSEGEKQKERYANKFETLVSGRLYSLVGVRAELRGSGIEALLSNDDTELLRASIFPAESGLSKKQVHLAIQEALGTNRAMAFSEHTMNRARDLFRFLRKLGDSKRN